MTPSNYVNEVLRRVKASPEGVASPLLSERLSPFVLSKEEKDYILQEMRKWEEAKKERSS